MSFLLRCLVVLGLVGVSIGCGQDQQQMMLGEMASQGQVWTHAAPPRYEISIQYDCFCAGTLVRSVVDHGQVVDIAPADAEPFTVDTLFAQARSALAQDHASAAVEYDPMLGYPTRFAVDRDRNTIDDEWGFHVTCFATADAHCPTDSLSHEQP